MEAFKVGGKSSIILTMCNRVSSTTKCCGSWSRDGYWVDPVVALLTGSTAMTGGHGTAALAMAPIIEDLGHTGQKV